MAEKSLHAEIATMLTLLTFSTAASTCSAIPAVLLSLKKVTASSRTRGTVTFSKDPNFFEFVLFLSCCDKTGMEQTGEIHENTTGI